MKLFGVGCLHFSFKEGISKEITVQDYVDEIKASLEKLATISDVECYFNEDIKNAKIDISSSNQISDREPCYPQILDFELSFNLYLPKRVQAEIINCKQDYLHTDTENFRIIFKHDWHGPFTIIESIGARKESKPSTAIQIVREYFKKEIHNVSDILQLECIGPSPFHADFELSKCESQSFDNVSEFKLTHTKQLGYDKLHFEYIEDEFSSENEAFEYLIHKISSEIAFFYELKVMHSSRSHDWYIIQSKLQELLELEDGLYKKTIKDRYSKKPKLLHSLYREIGIFKGQEIYIRNIYEENYFNVYKNGNDNVYIKSFVDGAIENWSNYPVKETSEIVSYFESKSSRSIELSVIFLAAVFGGTIGATITVLFGV